MSNGLTVTLHLPLLLISVILLAVTLRTKQRTYFVQQCMRFYVCLLCWLACETSAFLIPNAAFIRYISDIKLIFVAFFSTTLFFMITGFYRLDRLFPKWLPPLVYAIPCITSVLVLCSPLHNLLMDRFVIVSLSPLLLSQAKYSIFPSGPFIGEYVRPFRIKPDETA